MPDGYRAKYPIQALEKAIDILTYIRDNASSQGLSLAQISDGVGIIKSNVHRVLDTLLEYDFVEKTGDGMYYRLGWGAYRLGCNIPSINNIESKVISSALSELSNFFGEIINLGIMADNSMMIIKRFFPNPSRYKHKLIANVTIGEHEPLHCTGIGKLFLSDMTDEEIASVFDKEPLKQLTEFSITDKQKLIAELSRVKKQGYAVDDRESSTEVFCIAAPVRNFEGKITSGISISVPAGRIMADKIEYTAERLKETALKISRSIGFE